jgi:Holliday junction resolvase RusA-like endonuclease
MGIPRGQDRARAFLPKGATRPVMTDTKENREDKRNIRAQVIAQGAKYLGEAPIALTLTFYYPRPQSHFTRKGLRPDAPSVKDNGTDLSNLIKAVEDALTGIVWHDDRQICWEFARKVYTLVEPRTEIKVEIAK